MVVVQRLIRPRVAACQDGIAFLVAWSRRSTVPLPLIPAPRIALLGLWPFAHLLGFARIAAAFAFDILALILSHHASLVWPALRDHHVRRDIVAPLALIA
jgi:hypothetical protein